VLSSKKSSPSQSALSTTTFALCAHAALTRSVASLALRGGAPSVEQSSTFTSPSSYARCADVMLDREQLDDLLGGRQVGQHVVRAGGLEVGGRVASGGDREDPHAARAAARDVVRRIPDDHRVLRSHLAAPVLARALQRDRRQLLADLAVRAIAPDRESAPEP